MNKFYPPYDKCLHFITGFFIFEISTIFVSDWIALVIVSLFGAGKEIYDYFDYGKFDILDAAFTVIPAWVIIILKYFGA